MPFLIPRVQLSVHPCCLKTNFAANQDLKKTLVNVITKSGSTAETMSQFMIVKNILEQELGSNYRYNLVATTDKKTGIFS